MPHPHRRAAYSLIELMVVLGIISAITAIGVGTVRELLPRYRLVKLGRQLEGDLTALRNTAISLNRETRLVLVAADADWQDPSAPHEGTWLMQVGDRAMGSTRWDTLPADAEDDGTDDDQSLGRVDIGVDGEDEARDISLKPWSTLNGPGVGNTDSIVFSPRGWVSNPSADFDSTGWVRIGLVNKSALVQGVDDSVEVRLARSGFIRVVSSLGKDPGGASGTNTASTSGGS